ncbi:MAG: pentapeptide repeat-containing protein [Hormoscilla sp. GM102CHS1]|nr:pentapeptide repeat-containing protein [Hormoscilla sp. GM102CHS1]
MSGAFLEKANLRGANIEGTNLDGSYLCRTTMPDGTIDNSSC